MIDRRNSLISEINQLRTMMDAVPEGAVLDLISLRNRLHSAEEELEQLPLQSIRTRTSLTFRGSPVKGSRGINAEFGSKAARGFNDAYAAIVAGVKQNLRYMGPIPDRANHELLIVGTAIGSFGFEFELPEAEPDLLYDGQTLEEGAIEKLRSLMELSATGTDEEMSDVVDDIHPRAVKKVSDFVALLAQSEATCALEIGHRSFRYHDVEQLRVSAARLAGDNIKEGTETLTGVFLGVLPNSRNFEFRVADDQRVIRGKLAAEIENPEDLNGQLDVLVTVPFEYIQVGQGRPRFTLPRLNVIRRGL